MLTKNKIETDRTVPRDECITAGEIDRYVRQNPSKKLLGTNLPAWLYNQADPNKENGWNNLLRRLGSEPVILDTVQTAASNRNIKLYMDSRGFYESTSRYEIEYKRNRKAVVTYSVRQGAPYRINSLSYDYQDKFLEQVIRQDSAATLIRPGDIFDLTLLNDERQRITAYLKDRGYYKFSVNNISYIADTLAGDHLVDLTMVIRQQLEGYTPEGEPIYGNNAVYRLGKIFVYPDYDATAAATDPAYLRGMDTMEAVAATERFLDNAVMAKLEKVTIIHGKGTGALRAAVQQSLRRNKAVKSFRLGRYGEGESGVTVFELK